MLRSGEVAVLAQHVPHCLLGENEATGQEHFSQITQAQLVAQSPEHHEGDDVAWVLRLVQRAGATFVELLAALTAEPAIALCRPLRPFARRGGATCRTAHLLSLPLARRSLAHN